MDKPETRSSLRRHIGFFYHALKKRVYWHASKTSFAQTLLKEELPVTAAAHATPLMRQLNNVDMWMQHNKTENLKIAVQCLNGLVIKPGEVFSYWRQIGNPTKRKGYRKGMILRDGALRAGIGGGLCQLSNLIFWMTIHTPLTVIERWRHSYDVFPDAERTQPFGSGATCSYPNIDLQIKNTTAQPFQLKLEVTATHLVGAWVTDRKIPFAYKIVERDHEIKGEWWGGYTRHNTLVRRGFDLETGLQLPDEIIARNEAIMMYDPFINEHTKTASL